MTAFDQASDEAEVIDNGTVLGGRFTIRERLGEGGMGVVYRALDSRRNEEVALKLIVQRYLNRPERITRFFNEARLGQQVEASPYVVEFFEHGRLQSDGHPFISLELLPWRSLSAETVLAKLSPRQICLYARRIVEGLLTLHRNGIVHRDINMRNVLVSGEQLKLIDLSLAGQYDGERGPEFGDARRLTRAGDCLGTGGYMSLEQTMNEPPHPSMDVYALGVVLFELITGRNPFGSMSRAMFISLQIAGSLDEPRINAAIYRVPQSLVDLVERCTARYASERPTMAQVAHELEVLLAAMGVPWTEGTVQQGEPESRAGKTELDLVPQPAALRSHEFEEQETRLHPRTPDKVAEPRHARQLAKPRDEKPVTQFVERPLDALQQPMSSPVEPERQLPSFAVPSSPQPLEKHRRALLWGLSGAAALLFVVLLWGTWTEPAPVESSPARAGSSEVELVPVAETPKQVKPDPSVSQPKVELRPEANDAPGPSSLEAAAAHSNAPSQLKEPEASPPSRKRTEERPAQSKAPRENGSRNAPFERPTPPHQTAACKQARAAAEAANGKGNFRAVLEQTDRAECWAKATERLLLRAEAFSELEQFDRCFEIADKSNDERMKRWAIICRRR